MPRPRSKPLPRGVFVRRYASGSVAYWIAFALESGDVEREVAGGSLSDATALLARRRREVAEGTYDAGTGTREQSLERYAERAFAVRAEKGVRTVARERQLFADHVAPTLGAKRLEQIAPRDIERWVDGLTRAGKLSPKSILNAHGVLAVILQRARFDGLVPSNAARDLPAGTLPRNVRRRQVASWTRDEALALVTCEAIPEEHRVAGAIAMFTGARCGEVAGLRWRDLDTRAPVLWRWALRTQYEGQELKTDRPRDVPIHGELARLLAAWRLGGWAKLVGRVPRPSDFVVPRHDGTCHSDDSLGAKAVHRHAKLAGVDSTGRDFHSFRRFMITHARTDGASAELLERVTHNAKGTTLDGYTYFGWPELCGAVSCLRLDLARGAPVVRLEERRRAVGDEARASSESETAPGEGGGGSPATSPDAVSVSIPLAGSWRRRESNHEPSTPADAGTRNPREKRGAPPSEPSPSIPRGSAIVGAGEPRVKRTRASTAAELLGAAAELEEVGDVAGGQMLRAAAAALVR